MFLREIRNNFTQEGQKKSTRGRQPEGGFFLSRGREVIPYLAQKHADTTFLNSTSQFLQKIYIILLQKMHFKNVLKLKIFP